MLTEQLHYFTLVYETQSLSSAAKRIPMSVQGITKAMRAIEKEFSVPLISADDSGSLVLTPYAAELYEFVKKWNHNELLLKGAFDRIKAREKNQIRVGFSLGVLGHLGPKFLFEFYEQNPDIHIVYNEYADASCDKGLREGTFDIAFTLHPYDKDFITTELYKAQMEYWIPREHPLSEKKYLSIYDFEGEAIAIPGETFKCYESLLTLCRLHNVTLRKVFEITELFRIYEFVLNNEGLGYTARGISKLKVFQNSDSIVIVPFKDQEWHFGISYLPTHILTEPEQRFYRYCIEYSRGL